MLQSNLKDAVLLQPQPVDKLAKLGTAVPGHGGVGNDEDLTYFIT